MFCPKCGKQTKTIDSRRSPGKVRRRKRCFHCEYRFTTLELIRPSSDFSDVIRKRAEEFFFKGKKVSAFDRMALKELSAFGFLLVDEYSKGEL